MSLGYWWFCPYLRATLFKASFKLFVLVNVTNYWAKPLVTVVDIVYSGTSDLQELLSDLTTGATIGIHSSRRASASRIDVRSGGEAPPNTAIEAMVLAHGMILTMVVFTQTEKPIM